MIAVVSDPRWDAPDSEIEATVKFPSSGFLTLERKVKTDRKWCDIQELTVVHLFVDALEEPSTVLRIHRSPKPLIIINSAQSLGLRLFEPALFMYTKSKPASPSLCQECELLTAWSSVSSR